MAEVPCKKRVAFFFYMLYYKKSIGALAQLVARNVRNVEVTGSNPVCSTKGKPRVRKNSGLFFGSSAIIVELENRIVEKGLKENT